MLLRRECWEEGERSFTLFWLKISSLCICPHWPSYLQKVVVKGCILSNPYANISILHFTYSRPMPGNIFQSNLNKLQVTSNLLRPSQNFLSCFLDCLQNPTPQRQRVPEGNSSRIQFLLHFLTWHGKLLFCYSKGQEELYRARLIIIQNSTARGC